MEAGHGYRYVLGWCMLALDLGLSLLALCLLWWRHRYPPLRAHHPMLLASMVLPRVLGICWVQLREIGWLEVSCYSVAWFGLTLQSLYTVPVIIWTYRLVLISEYEQRKVAFAQSQLAKAFSRARAGLTIFASSAAAAAAAPAAAGNGHGHGHTNGAAGTVAPARPGVSAPGSSPRAQAALNAADSVATFAAIALTPRGTPRAAVDGSPRAGGGSGAGGVTGAAGGLDGLKSSPTGRASHAGGGGGGVLADATSIDLTVNLTTQRMLLVLAGYCAPLFVTSALFLAFDTSYDWRGTVGTCSYHNWIVIPYGLGLVSASAIGGWLQNRLKTVTGNRYDAFGLRRTLTLMIAYSQVLALLFVLLNIFVPDINSRYIESAYVMMATSTIRTLHVIVVPALHTFRADNVAGLAALTGANPAAKHLGKQVIGHGPRTVTVAPAGGSGGGGSGAAGGASGAGAGSKFRFPIRTIANTATGGGGTARARTFTGGGTGTPLLGPVHYSREESKIHSRIFAPDAGGGGGGELALTTVTHGGTSGAASSTTTVFDRFPIAGRPLYRVLTDAAGFEAFVTHLQLEFAAENALFFRAVEQYRAEPSLSAAVFIYHTFVSNVTAQLQVNLSHGVTAAVEHTLSALVTAAQQHHHQHVGGVGGAHAPGPAVSLPHTPTGATAHTTSVMVATGSSLALLGGGPVAGLDLGSAAAAPITPTRRTVGGGGGGGTQSGGVSGGTSGAITARSESPLIPPLRPLLGLGSPTAADTAAAAAGLPGTPGGSASVPDTARPPPPVLSIAPPVGHEHAVILTRRSPTGLGAEPLVAGCASSDAHATGAMAAGSTAASIPNAVPTGASPAAPPTAPPPATARPSIKAGNHLATPSHATRPGGFGISAATAAAAAAAAAPTPRMATFSGPIGVGGAIPGTASGHSPKAGPLSANSSSGAGGSSSLHGASAAVLPHVFDSAQREVFLVMESHSFPRFKSSALGKQCAALWSAPGPASVISGGGGGGGGGSGAGSGNVTAAASPRAPTAAGGANGAVATTAAAPQSVALTVTPLTLPHPSPPMDGRYVVTSATAPSQVRQLRSSVSGAGAAGLNGAPAVGTTTASTISAHGITLS